jgi:hypothetical protein
MIRKMKVCSQITGSRKAIYLTFRYISYKISFYSRFPGQLTNSGTGNCLCFQRVGTNSAFSLGFKVSFQQPRLLSANRDVKRVSVPVHLFEQCCGAGAGAGAGGAATFCLRRSLSFFWPGSGSGAGYVNSYEMLQKT